MDQSVNISLVIDAESAKVWNTLTNFEWVKQWMGDPEMNIEIETTWEENTPVIIRGFHHVAFENKGTVLEFNPNKTLTYTHLSSVSRLPDLPENYSKLRFDLKPDGEQTHLSLTISGFPTESICKHLAFYWRNTLPLIKNLVETTS